eukprot:4907339-Prorocentrum_lima.AAC.1
MRHKFRSGVPVGLAKDHTCGQAVIALRVDPWVLSAEQLSDLLSRCPVERRKPEAQQKGSRGLSHLSLVN